jgi:FlaA1/EpsC-like NDP-sugar epimerase
MDVIGLLGRSKLMFDDDIARHDATLRAIVGGGRFLVIGGAGSIGQAVTREIFKRNPRLLHVVDISENNMVELVRDIRSTLGYIDGEFATFALDCDSREFEALVRSGGGYDFVLNLSALKHVRSEKDVFTLMRMIGVNIFNTVSSMRLAREHGAQRYFCVSTDKAANPVNMMGASKRIMEMFAMRESESLPLTMARFANVAFSDGSLLHGFQQRIAKQQPISAPNDVRRYFIVPQEAGELCLMACLLGGNRDIFFPKHGDELVLTTFSEIAERYVRSLGYEPYACASEDEARDRAEELIATRRWPCYFFASDTTGEKPFEEFYTGAEDLDFERFAGMGIIRNAADYDAAALDRFAAGVAAFRGGTDWNKRQLIALFEELLPEFAHLETGKYLDARM